MWQNSKTQIVIKLINWNCDQTQNSNWDKTKNSNCDETQIVTKVELWQNSSCDLSQIEAKPKLWKSPVVIKIHLWQKSNCKRKKPQCDNSNCDQTWGIKLWQNSNYDKAQN